MDYNCPKCGSDRTTKYSLYLKNKKSNTGLLIFLLIVLILLISSGIAIPTVAIAGVAVALIALILSPLFVLAVIIMVIADYIRYHNKFICERCGKKFRLKY